MRTLELVRFDEILATQRPRSALGAISELELAPSALDSQAAARRVLGWGQWNHGYLCEDPATVIASAWGGTFFTGSGGVTYRNPGMRSGDHAIGGGTAGAFFSNSGPTPFQVGATEDFAVLFAIPKLSVVGADVISYMQSTPFGGPFIAVRFVIGSPGYHDILVNDGVDTCQAFIVDANPTAGPLVVGGALERSTNKLIAGYCHIGSAPVVSGQIDASAIGAINHAGGAYLLIPATPSTEQSTMAHWMASVGVDAGKGLAANWSTVLQRYADAVSTIPSIVDAAAGRGRSFVALSRTAYEASDVTPGATLATRDASVQALVRFDLADQAGAMQWTIAKATGSNGVDDAGIASTETIVGDGYVEFSPTEGAGGGRCIGLSTSVSGAFTQIDYMIAVEGLPGGNINVWENGASGFGGGTIAGWVPGSILRIERVGTTISYKYNGNTFYTSATPSSGPLMIDVRFFTVGSFLTRVRLVDAGVPKGITWKSITNMTATPVPSTAAGVIYARGKGGSAAEGLSAGVELRVPNAAGAIGELAWIWQDSGGADRRQVGGQFTIPPSGEILLTATRGWVSSSEVVLRYYLGDQLLNEVTSTDGDIGGGTTGTTTIGGRRRGGYPRSTAAMAAITYPGAKWSHIWLLDETSGNLAPAAGTVSLVPSSSPVYGRTGARRGIDGVDNAIGFDSALDSFSGADNFDVDANGDLIVAWVVRCNGDAPINADWFEKGWNPFPGWLIYRAAAGGAINFTFRDGVNNPGVAVVPPTIEAHAGLAVLERATGQLTVIVEGLASGVRSRQTGNIGALGDCSNALNFTFGSGPNGFAQADTKTDFSMFAIGSGVGAATGFTAKIDDAIATFAAAARDSYGDFLDGVIDELRVCDYELAPEEIAATWRRLTVEQPNGYQLVRELHPPGFPISADPSSRVQRETNLWGQALGYATAQAENVRANILPDRAYGDTLTQWENIVKQPAKPGDSLDTRRARVLGRLRQHAGVSIPGVGEATKGLVGTAPANLEVMAFPQELVDHYEYPAVWSTGEGAKQTKTGAGGAWNSGASSRQTVAGDCYVEFIPTTITTDYMCGLAADDPDQNFATIDYAIYVKSGGNLESYENGIPTAIGSFVAGDVLRVERVGTTIRYRKNGVVLRTSSIPSSAPLLVDTSIFPNAATIEQIRFVAVEDTAQREIGIDWQNVVGVSITPARYVPYRGGFAAKRSAGAIWANRARSIESFAGDGYVETTIRTSVAVNTYRALSLTKASDVIGSDVSENTTDYAFGIGLGANQGRIVERGVVKLTPVAVTVGDVVRIERIGSTIYYKVNGVTIYTSLTPVTEALVVDASFFDASTQIESVELVDAGKRVSFTWRAYTTTGETSTTTIAYADATRVQGTNGQDLRYLNWQKSWKTATAPISTITWLRTTNFQNQNRDNAASGFGAHLLTKIEPIALPSRAEVGIAFYDEAREHAFLLGLRNDAGTYRIVTERITAGISAGAVNRAVTALQGHWLHLYVQAPLPPARTTTIGVNQGNGGQPTENDWQLTAEWSTTGRLSGYTSYADANAMINARFQNAVLYARSFDIAGSFTLSGALDAYFDETHVFTPYGDRSLRFYVYRPPSLAGSPDPIGANGVIGSLKHANTVAGFTQSRSLLYDTDGHGFDLGPLGGY